MQVTCSVVFVPVSEERRAAWQAAIQILGMLVVEDALARIQAECGDPGAEPSPGTGPEEQSADGEIAALVDESRTGIKDIALSE